MEFRILGPLEVLRDGESFAVGAAQQRALLAVLLLHRGEAVSVDRLIDELWGERPPATAAKTVQVYVSQLRKALGAGVIVTQGRGYRLAVEAEHVDVGRFELLSAEGKRALANGDPSQASERLRAALGLWRGEPLADFAYAPFAQSAIARLQEARLAAIEDRIDADLAVGRDGELILELESLIAENPLRERLRGQLMRALYRSGRQADALAVYREGSQLLRDELGLDPGRELRQLERLILTQDLSLDSAPGARPATGGGAVGVCPFKGLAFFDRSDAEFFCGRDRLISDLVARCAESTLVGMLGPSGVGKSSVLRAGLLPALNAGALPGSAGWHQVVMRPGEHPASEFVRALGGEGLDAALAGLPGGARIVIAVDQLEELFTVCDEEEERTTFLAQLVAAARDKSRRALVLVALRADFYGLLSAHQRFAELLSASHVLVGPMDRDELTDAIEQPAARAGLEIERPLVDELIAAVVGEPGALPLLSTTLLELWRGRDGRAMRYESYRAIGGVQRAIGRLAETAYGSLDERERHIARSVMLRLASGDGATLARRPVPLAELTRLEGAEPVIRALTDARLLTVGGDDQVELSHEALLHEWARYRAWLEDDEGGRRLHARVTAAAVEWDAEGRDRGALYRGARLTGVLEWSAQHRDELGALEREFIAASRRAAEREARRLRGILAGVAALLLVSLVAGAVALIQKGHATRQARVALARQLAADALSEPRVDLAVLLARQAVNLDRSAPTEGSLLATLLQNPALNATFPQASGSSSGLAVSPDGRTLLAADWVTGQIRVYDTHRRSRPRAVVNDFIGDQPPVYSADGSLVLYVALTGVAVRRSSTLGLVGTLQFDPNWITHEGGAVPSGGVQVTPDGRSAYLVYMLQDVAGNPTAAYVDRWSLPGGESMSTNRIGSDAVLAARLVQAGSRLVTLGTRGVKVFDARSMRQLQSIALRPAPPSPTSAAISPDGRKIAIGSENGSVYFVQLSNGHPQPAIPGHAAAVSQVLYSEDGRSVVTVGGDDQLIVWDPSTAARVQALTAHAGRVGSAALTGDASTLYTSSADAGLLEWDLGGADGFRHRAHVSPAAPPCCDVLSPPVPALTVSHDGSTFAAVLSPSTVGIFSTRTLQRLGTIKPGNIGITGVAWSPTGPQLAVVGHAGAVQLWTLEGTPRRVRSLSGLQSPVAQPEAIEAVAFSRDGTLLAATDYAENPPSPGLPETPFARLAIWRTDTGALVAQPRDLGVGRPVAVAFSPTAGRLAVDLPQGDTLILDASTGQVRRTLHPADPSTTVAFAPDGILAIGTDAGTVQLWDPTSGRPVSSPALTSSPGVASVAFDATGRRFATAGFNEGTAKLWRASTLQQVGTALATDPDATATVAFGAGPNLLAVDDHGNAFAWATSLDAWEQRACTVAGRDLTHAEWAHYANGLTYAPACPPKR